jgi:ribosomal protein S12 methylthiotransferase
VDEILAEAEMLAGAGVKELILVAQNTTAYGRDVDLDKGGLAFLLHRMARIPELAWIRVLYGHPDFLSESLIESMASHPNICPYLDIPFQHGSSRILKKMGRGHDVARNLERVKQIRREIPGVALRSTFMTGFPGETDRDFDEMVAFVEEARFDHMGAFVYSDDVDLPSHKLPERVDQPTKQARFDQLMQRQAIISRENNERYVGKTVRVLVDGTDRNNTSVMTGRMVTQAPEIDGIVSIEACTAPRGTFVDVRITHVDDYDLTGRML